MMLDDDRLASQLKAELSTVTLDRPLSQVERHGRALRRRRRAPVVVTSVVLTLAVGMSLLSVFAVPTGSGSRAMASWTRSPQPSDSQTTDIIASTCAAGLGGGAGLDAEPVVIDRRGTVAVSLVRVGDRMTACSSFRGAPDSPVPWAQGGAAALDALASRPGVPARTLDVRALGRTTVRPLHVDVAWAAGRVDASVARLTFRSRGVVVTATIHDGWFVAWWPAHEGVLDRLLPRDWRRPSRVRATAYGADGRVLDSVVQRAP